MLVHGERISEALLNLLSNSIDACAEGDSITIKVDLKSENNNVLEILVSDTGSGIPKEIRPQIFTAFFTTKPFGKGTGLGMTIVKKVVDAHGGSVEILDTERGTSILLRLPVG
jgi:signal transduction histidine kinase